MSETILVEVEDTPTQVVTIEQEQIQSVVIEENLPTVLELTSEGLQGPPGTPGNPGPPGPAGPDLNLDLVDLSLVFNNVLI